MRTRKCLIDLHRPPETVSAEPGVGADVTTAGAEINLFNTVAIRCPKKWGKIKNKHISVCKLLDGLSLSKMLGKDDGGSTSRGVGVRSSSGSTVQLGEASRGCRQSGRKASALAPSQHHG